MPDIKRVINTKFWDDDKVINQFSPEDKYFLLYLLTNKHTSQIGIYPLVPRQAAFELGYSAEAVSILLDRFETKYDIIRYSKDTCEVAIKNYLFHSVIKGGKPVMDCLFKEEKDVIDKSLLWFILDGLDRKYHMQPKKMNATVLEFMDHLREERTKEENNNTVIYGSLNVNNNDNDNDNERYVHESYHESYHDSSHYGKPNKRFVPPTVEEVRAYCTEKGLTNVNPESFVDFYGSKDWYVGKNKMVNWHMAASGWNSRNGKRNQASQFNREAWLKS